MKKIYFIILSLLMATIITGCGAEAADIYTSVYPVEFLVKEIVQDELVVASVFPKGQDIHDFEIPYRTSVNMTKSKAIFYIGLGLEPQIENSKNASLKNVRTVALANELEGLLDGDGTSHNHGNEDEHNDVHYLDPHVWLNPQMMQDMALIVLNTVNEIMPAKKDFFTENYEKLIIKLKVLDDEIFEIVNSENLITKKLMVDHNAYSYLNRYGIEILKIRLNNEVTEISIPEYNQIIKTAKDNQIKYIVVTKNVASPELLVDRIIRDINGEKIEIHNLETITLKEEKEGKDYISIMKDNIETLRKIFLKELD